MDLRMIKSTNIRAAKIAISMVYRMKPAEIILPLFLKRKIRIDKPFLFYRHHADLFTYQSRSHV